MPGQVLLRHHGAREHVRSCEQCAGFRADITLRKELQCTLPLARCVCLAHCHYDTVVLRWFACLLVSASFMTGRSIAWVERAKLASFSPSSLRYSF
jgi:hypothetical protein